MREILFRGKRLDNGEWVEGSLISFDCKSKVIFPSGSKVYMPQGKNVFCSTECYDVSHATIGQYTGLKDKNGKRIFEGDIVSFKRVNSLGYTTNRIGVVRYYYELPIFYIMATTGDAWDWCDCEEIEIIGNIHDNLELLEGGRTDGQ